MKDFTHREALLIELVHILSYGSEKELGLSLSEVMAFLDSRVKSKDNAKVLDLLDTEGRDVIDKLKKSLKEYEKQKPKK